MQVIAFDAFCANVQRDVNSVLAMHHVNCLAGPSGSCRGNAPIIAGLNIPMPEPAESKADKEPKSELEASSVSPEAVITITSDSGSTSA